MQKRKREKLRILGTLYGSAIIIKHGAGVSRSSIEYEKLLIHVNAEVNDR